MTSSRDSVRLPAGAGRLADYGIEAVDVGLTRILLPEEVTKAVFDRMKSSRERLAREIESEGQSQAQSIRVRAESDAKRIRAFADQFAQSIRDSGDREATAFLAQMNTNPELAVFLEKVRFIREVQPRTATLIFSTEMPGVDLLSPDSLNAGRASSHWLDDLMKSRAAAPAPSGGTGTQPSVTNAGGGQ